MVLYIHECDWLKEKDEIKTVSLVREPDRVTTAIKTSFIINRKTPQQGRSFC